MKPIREWSVFAQVLLALVAFVFGIPVALVLIAAVLANVGSGEVALAAIVIGAALLYNGWERRRRAARARANRGRRRRARRGRGRTAAPG